jgi:hypothetical protein
MTRRAARPAGLTELGRVTRTSLRHRVSASGAAARERRDSERPGSFTGRPAGLGRDRLADAMMRAEKGRIMIGRQTC